MSWLRELRRKLPLNFRGDYKFNESLSKHTTFKIGGRCWVWCEPKDLEDLKFILRYRKDKNIPLFIIGEGSNILVKDYLFKGIFIHLDSPYFKRIEFKDNCVSVGAGVRLNELIKSSLERNLGNLEFLTGIPGSLGGALVMNAGIKTTTINQKPQTISIGDLVKKVTVMDYNGKIKTLNKKQLRFGYRNSNLSKYIILSAELKLKKQSQKNILERIKRFLKYRKDTQDLSNPSCGCIFKNPVGYSAGRLIQDCDLKGKRIGGAQVSLKHANFILNIGRAKARDVLRLMRFIQKKVYKKYRIWLSPEIKIV